MDRLEIKDLGFIPKANEFSRQQATWNYPIFDACPKPLGQDILTAMNPEEVISSFTIQLPPAPAVAGLYKPLVIVGDLAYLSGHLPIMNDGTPMVGEVGNGKTVEEGNAAARQAGLNMLATLRAGLGSLDKVSRVVKLLGLVNSPGGFTQHPQVINGCSELFKEVFGEENGVGARSALGVSGLPAGVMVEIEGIFQIDL